MTGLPDKIVGIHLALNNAAVPHAFGGASALAWCTRRARGTIDIDINIFVDRLQAETVFKDLPDQVIWSPADLEQVQREGQVRLWWERTPIDIFLNTTRLHEQMSARCRWESFMGETIPFVSCHDLAILKVFFNRTKDWADLEEMQAAGTLNIPAITGTIVEYLGADDERLPKLNELASLPQRD